MLADVGTLRDVKESAWSRSQSKLLHAGHFSQASRDKGCACHAHETLADTRPPLTSPGSAFASKQSHRDKGT